MNIRSRLYAVQRLGVTQTELGNRAGVPESTIRKLMFGQRVMIDCEAKVTHWINNHKPVLFSGDVFFVRAE